MLLARLQSQSFYNWLLLALLIMFWGTAFLFITLSLASFSPIGIVAMRVMLGALVLYSVLKWQGLHLPKEWRAWLLFALFSLVGNILPFYFISLGQQHVSSGMAGLLMALMPLLTMMLAHYCIVGESLNRYKVLGFFLGLMGVGIILAPSLSIGLLDHTLVGSVLILLAVVCYSVNAILIKRLPKFNPIVAGSGVLLSASVLMLPLWLYYDKPWLEEYSTSSVISLLWLGIGPTGIATLVYFTVLERTGPTFLSNINYCIPVVAYFAGVSMLGESLEWQSILGLVCIMIGIALTHKKRKSIL